MKVDLDLSLELLLFSKSPRAVDSPNGRRGQTSNNGSLLGFFFFFFYRKEYNYVSMYEYSSFIFFLILGLSFFGGGGKVDFGAPLRRPPPGRDKPPYERPSIDRHASQSQVSDTKQVPDANKNNKEWMLPIHNIESGKQDQRKPATRKHGGREREMND